MSTKPKVSKKPADVAKRLSRALDKSETEFTTALVEVIKEHGGIASMAKKIGVSRHTLYRYEWATDRPMLETVVKMTAACGLKLIVVPDDGSGPKEFR